mgnify:FL=1
MKKVLLGLVITIMLINNGYAKNFKQRANQELIVIFELSYSEDFEIIEKYLIDEEVPFIFGVNKDNLTRFEWFFNLNEKTATLIEVSKSSAAWEELVSKVVGTPVNVKFNKLFKIEKLTVLGDATNNLKKKIELMNPEFKSYKAGFISKVTKERLKKTGGRY